MGAQAISTAVLGVTAYGAQVSIVRVPSFPCVASTAPQAKPHTHGTQTPQHDHHSQITS